MKRLIFYVLSAMWILLPGCASESSTITYKCGLIDSSTVILSLVIPDSEKHIENDLIIFALVKNGEFISIDDYNNKSDKEVKERDSIFGEVKSFYTCAKGSQVLIQIDSVISSAYDCDDIRVGRFGPRFKLLNNSVATNFKIPCDRQFEKVNKDSRDSLFFRITNGSLFGDLNAHFEKIDFDIIRLLDSKDFLCFAKAEDSLKAISNVYFLNLSNNSLKLIDLISEELELDSWGRGNEFLDYIDIDNDKIPELFILYHGYEWTTIIIYKKVGNKYVKKLENTIFGC